MCTVLFIPLRMVHKAFLSTAVIIDHLLDALDCAVIWSEGLWKMRHDLVQDAA